VSALVFTGAFWVAGHFGPEMKFLIDKRFGEAGASRAVVTAVTSLIPNFQYFNYRDTFRLPGFNGWDVMGTAFLYGAAYTAFFLILSSLWFSRKEF
jgi:hypothetical protein